MTRKGGFVFDDNAYMLVDVRSPKHGRKPRPDHRFAQREGWSNRTRTERLIVKVEGAGFKATGNEVAIESMVVTHEGRSCITYQLHDRLPSTGRCSLPGAFISGQFAGTG